ncbi:Na/Pi cotransporter family protein [Arenibaculum pallidiluteum]|uniref:Na/Pi cotransporter family protein n=1 Tax=Arenibaculum pallidiluteum TaxID=2812559 RepID=UPI001A95F9DB|nr:Na/Pi cotransporter family protein [Arenibaculum pallidiluteum]
MSMTHALVDLLGEVALLLWGIHMVHDGVLRAFGSDLRRLLEVGLADRPRAFLAGLGVTAALQSSTATALMTTSFTASASVGLVPALAVMLGANVGTTLIVQVLSFDITLVFPVLIFAGFLTYRRARRARPRELGRVSMGLGLMLLSLHLLLGTVAPVEGSAVARDFLRAITQDAVLNLVLAALLTWAAHSSVAAILFVMSLAGAGVVTTEAALAMVLGANLGSAVNPVVAALGGDPVRLRMPLGNLLNRLIGCALMLPLLGPIAGLFEMTGAGAARHAVDFHTAFNLAAALVAMPLLSPAARALEWLLPRRAASADPAAPVYLDPAALATPSVALANAEREVLRMADVVETMLRGSLDLLRTDDRDRLAELRRLDDRLDRLHGEIQRYLAAASRATLSETETRRLSEILAFAINLEHIGDIVDKSVMELLAKRMRLHLSLPPDSLADAEDMHLRLVDHLHLAIAVFMLGDSAAARRLVEEKERFRELEGRARQRHFDGMRSGSPGVEEASSLHLDLARDLKRIEAHIAATAHPLLERVGALRSTRLAS